MALEAYHSGPPDMNEDAIWNMRARIERCRRLAGETTDDRAAKILRDMANEGEADLARMLLEDRAELHAEKRQHGSDDHVGKRYADYRREDNEL